jgi:hypothetical protein
MRPFKYAYLAAALTFVPAQLLVPSADGQSGPKPSSGQARDPAIPRDTPGERPSTRIEDLKLESVLGMQVRTQSEESMGRIIDLLIDRSGKVEAAVIEFGGFLGIGTRKIAVEWSALRVVEAKDKSPFAILDATRDQFLLAPEFRPDQPPVVFRVGQPDSPPVEPPEATAKQPSSGTPAPAENTSRRKRHRQ